MRVTIAAIAYAKKKPPTSPRLEASAYGARKVNSAARPMPNRNVATNTTRSSRRAARRSQAVTRGSRSLAACPGAAGSARASCSSDVTSSDSALNAAAHRKYVGAPKPSSSHSLSGGPSPFVNMPATPNIATPSMRRSSGTMCAA